MKSSLRDRMRLLIELFEIERDKCAAVERLLAQHHGAETVTEEQIQGCETCAPLLTKG